MLLAGNILLFKDNRVSRRTQLLFILLILICQLLIRIHRPAELPGFIDEYRHISRAQMVYEFQQNPIEFSHGKLLFYYYLGLFAPEGQGALVTARLAVAIFSLLGGAAAAAIARLLFGRQAMIPALAYYALVPHAVFYERMALADSFAGALAAMTVWQSIRLVHKPSRRRGLVAGLLAAASGLAKLIAVPLVGMPFLAVLLLNHVRLRGRSLVSISDWSQVLWHRYGRALNAVRNVNIIPWTLVVLALVISLQTGGHPVILDSRLLGIRDQTSGTWDTKIDELIEAFDTLVSIPMTLLLAALILFLLRKHPAKTLFVLSWLALLWIPGIIIGTRAEARYLLIGQPALAVLFGGGIMLVGRQLGAWIVSLTGNPALCRWAAVGLMIVVLGVWGGLFAIPFAIETSRDPALLDLPRLDAYIYFAAPANAWGIRESLDYLDAHGERVDGQIPVVGVLEYTDGVAEYCDLIDLYLREDVAWDCTNQVDFPAAITEWPPLARYLERWPFLYVITDTVAPETPLDDAKYQQVFVAPRPHNGQDVSVWRVTGP